MQKKRNCIQDNELEYPRAWIRKVYVSNRETTQFEIGVGMGTTDPEEMRRVARAGDEAGMSFVSIGDNPGQQMETFVSLTLLTSATRRCRVGTAMTNPLGRDPLIVASALSTLDKMAPGRVFL